MIIMTFILCALEWASRMALNIFPDQSFTISIVLPIALIGMMRHGALGVLLAAVGGLVYCITNGAESNVYFIYILGNSFIAFNLFWFKKLGKENIRERIGLVILYVISGYILINLGRSISALILGNTPFFPTAVRYFTTDALSAVMSVIIVLIARKQDGVFEDQMIFLKRLAAEEENRNASQA
jgi:hypothetical protein